MGASGTTASHGLRVVQLRISAFKGITVADITPPEDGVVVVSGKNGAGKSSIMDSISVALGGAPETRKVSQPVKKGNNRSQVVVDLGDLTVTREWNSDGDSWLTVVGADGRERRSPQRLLNSLLGKLSFDPGAFLNESPAKQRDMLLQATGLGETVARIDAARKEASDERRLLNRNIKSIQAHLDSIPAPADDVPAEEVTVTELVERIRRTENANQRIMQARRRRDELQSSIAETEPTDVSDLENQVAQIDTINARVREARRWREAHEQLQRGMQQSQEYTARLEALNEEKAQALRETDLPIPGLGIDDDGITYNGVPFQDANTASKLQTATAIAMALNPTIRIIRIADGSLLDRENLAALNELAADKGYQVWVERVDDDEDSAEGIVIREGSVVANHYQES